MGRSQIVMGRADVCVNARRILGVGEGHQDLRVAVLLMVRDHYCSVLVGKGGRLPLMFVVMTDFLLFIVDCQISGVQLLVIAAQMETPWHVISRGQIRRIRV